MSLEHYEKAFAAGPFKRFSDGRYERVRSLVNLYAEPSAASVAQSKTFRMACEFVTPLIEVKNFKSQTPFPRKLAQVARNCVAIRQADVHSRGNRFDAIRPHFLSLIDQEGFQLPTVSAVLHFSHPRHFPIVDRYVAAACRELEPRLKHANLRAPKLPSADMEKENQFNRYTAFVEFIDYAATLWVSDYGRSPSYRRLDKALMVIGWQAS